MRHTAHPHQTQVKVAVCEAQATAEAIQRQQLQDLTALALMGLSVWAFCLSM